MSYVPSAVGTPLTLVELRVLAWTAEGMTTPEIARGRHYSEHTVASHLSRTYRKLGARNAPHAVLLAYQRGLLPFTETERAK